MGAWWRRALQWREQTLTDSRRDCLGKWALRGALAVMVSAWLASTLSGQVANEVSIARLEERVSAAEHSRDELRQQVSALDNKMWAGLVGIVALLADRALQYGKKGGK